MTTTSTPQKLFEKLIETAGTVDTMISPFTVRGAYKTNTTFFGADWQVVLALETQSCNAV